jgi:hypothetical protein
MHIHKKLVLSLLGLIVLATLGYFLLTERVPYSDEDTNAMSVGSTKRNSEIIVYETPVDGPDECSSYEDYDQQEGVCFYECENEAECTEIERLINNELDSWLDEGEQDNSPVQETPEGDVDMIVVYNVSPGEQIAVQSGSDDKKYRDLWDDVAALSPDTISDRYIESFGVYANKGDDTIAFVDDADMDGKWRMAINLAAYEQGTLREQKAILIHELGHVISLNTSQVNPNISNCKTLTIEEGCADKNSVVNTFWEKFWKDKGEQSYSKNSFVTQYATTDIVEDTAESFTYFVMDKGQEKLGDSVRNQKIKHFYRFPEMVNIRDSMRQVLGRDIVRAKKI